MMLIPIPLYISFNLSVQKNSKKSRVHHSGRLKENTFKNNFVFLLSIVFTLAEGLTIATKRHLHLREQIFYPLMLYPRDVNKIKMLIERIFGSEVTPG